MNLPVVVAEDGVETQGNVGVGAVGLDQQKQKMVAYNTVIAQNKSK